MPRLDLPRTLTASQPPGPRAAKTAPKAPSPIWPSSLLPETSKPGRTAAPMSSDISGSPSKTSCPPVRARAPEPKAADKARRDHRTIPRTYHAPFFRLARARCQGASARERDSAARTETQTFSGSPSSSNPVVSSRSCEEARGRGSRLWQ